MQPDYSLPPARYPAPQGYPRGAVTLWLAAAALSLLFVLLFSVFDALQAEVNRLQVAVVAAQVTRISPVSVEEIHALRTKAAEVTTTEEWLQATLIRYEQGGVPWLAILQRVVPVPPSEVRLTSLTQHQDTISIRGTVTGASALTAYVGRLRGSPLFADVHLEAATDSFAINLRLRGYEP